ncbi:hypothetical protein [Limosilactobacillus reuteri]|nr:hypothetical protein [Limosilactobacillus reuteri]
MGNIGNCKNTSKNHCKPPALAYPSNKLITAEPTAITVSKVKIKK